MSAQLRRRRRQWHPAYDVMCDRFTGEILGAGTAAGIRIVVGNWETSPYGRFADVMIERSDGRRILLAPTSLIAEYIAETYAFDDVRVTPVVVERSADWLRVEAGPLRAQADFGGRTMIGWVLHVLPRVVTASRWFCRAVDPVARVLLPGVRVYGSAGHERTEFYGAHDVHAVTALAASWHGHVLGDLAPVDPAPRFGFGSTPRRPSLTGVTTTVVRPLDSSGGSHAPAVPVSGGPAA